MNLYALGGAALVIVGLSGVAYVEHERVVAATARASIAERDRDAWKDNFDKADHAAKQNEAALDDLKSRLAASAASADEAKAAAAANKARYDAILAKAKEQHAPTDSSPFMRVFLDQLCIAQTTAACGNY